MTASGVGGAGAVGGRWLMADGDGGATGGVSGGWPFGEHAVATGPEGGMADGASCGFGGVSTTDALSNCGRAIIGRAQGLTLRRGLGRSLRGSRPTRRLRLERGVSSCTSLDVSAKLLPDVARKVERRKVLVVVVRALSTAAVPWLPYKAPAVRQEEREVCSGFSVTEANVTRMEQVKERGKTLNRAPERRTGGRQCHCLTAGGTRNCFPSDIKGVLYSRS